MPTDSKGAAAEDVLLKQWLAGVERLPPAAARALAESGDDTFFVGCPRCALPELRTRLGDTARISPRWPRRRPA